MVFSKKSKDFRIFPESDVNISVYYFNSDLIFMKKRQLAEITLNDVMDVLHNISKGVGALEKKMDGLEIRIGSLEKRMDSLEKRIDGLEKRIGSLEKRMDSLEKQVSFIKVKLVEHDERFDNLESRIEEVNENLTATADAMVGIDRYVRMELPMLGVRVDRVESKYNKFITAQLG